jgi:hypothetical protein
LYVLEPSKLVAPSSASLYDWAVKRVELTTGAAPTVATVSLPEFWNGPNGVGQPDAVISAGALYFLARPGDGAVSFVEEVRL